MLFANESVVFDGEQIFCGVLSIILLILLPIGIYSLFKAVGHNSPDEEPKKQSSGSSSGTSIVNGVEVPNNCSLDTMISISNSINKMKEYKSQFERYMEGEGKDGGHCFNFYGVCQCGATIGQFRFDEGSARCGYLDRLMFCPIYIKKMLAKNGMTTFFELDEVTMQPVEYVMWGDDKIRFTECCTLIVSKCMFEHVYYHRLLNNY